MKVSDYIIDFIAKQGVSHIFEFIGGAITHLVDSTVSRDDITCVSVHHEQSGAFAAEAYARINGRLGVAMATSGPGALNMVTGIGSCWFDSVPCLFITGQVNTYEYKFDRPLRQVGFQETDIVSVVKPITKFAQLITDAESVRYYLEKAVYLAQNGRPGPVLLDIPMNIQRAQIEPDAIEIFWGSEEHQALERSKPRCSENLLEEVWSLLKSSKRPVILAGGGVRTAGAVGQLQLFVEKTGIPVVTSLMGLDSLPYDHCESFGMIGTYGNRYSNLTLANCDVLLILGARLDSRQTGTRQKSFARAAKKIHVDIDPNELDAKIKVDIAINADISEFLGTLTDKCGETIELDLTGWHNTIESYRQRYPTRSQEKHSDRIEPNQFMELLSSASTPGDIICLDVGQNQMWAAQSFHLKESQRMLISGGMGAMGFSLPAGIGAAKAAYGKQVIVIAGDGGIQVNIQDLDTIASHCLNVKIVVLNNGCLGMVRQFQDMYFDGRRQSTVQGYSCPDLVAIAEAYGIKSWNVRTIADCKDALHDFLGFDGPAFLNVSLEQETSVNPKLLVNQPIENMSPYLDYDELKEIMLIDLLESKDEVS